MIWSHIRRGDVDFAIQILIPSEYDGIIVPIHDGDRDVYKHIGPLRAQSLFTNRGGWVNIGGVSKYFLGTCRGGQKFESHLIGGVRNLFYGN